ncbi:hypothetical protein J6590_056200 [Homalodisca vitripennis]|nr:hypothetical protein J6590_056200 [Homalodisca vitripennis]
MRNRRWKEVKWSDLGAPSGPPSRSNLERLEHPFHTRHFRQLRRNAGNVGANPNVRLNMDRAKMDAVGTADIANLTWRGRPIGVRRVRQSPLPQPPYHWLPLPYHGTARHTNTRV